MDSTQSLSTTVLFAVADAAAVDPMDLDRPLSTVFDPDALDALFRRDGSDGACSVSFRYGEFEVTVCDDGVVAVEPA